MEDQDVNIIQTFKEYAGKKPVRFTNHAIARLQESQLDIRRGKFELYEAVKSPFKVDWERKKYQDNKNTTTYWMTGPITFTVIETKGKKYGDDILLVITVTDSRCVDRYQGIREKITNGR